MESQEQKDKALALSELSPNKGSRRRRKRLGIGEGSGKGKTCGKGMKGQKSRSGYSQMAGFEGGQMPLHRRLPKYGFTSRKKTLGRNTYSVVDLNKVVSLGDEVTVEAIRAAGLVRGKSVRVKILAGEPLEKKVSVEAHAFSTSAREAIEAAGGEAKVIS